CWSRFQNSGNAPDEQPTERSHLVIELDGGQHQGNAADRERDAWLQAQGFRVLRFWNHDVLTRLDAVLERLYVTLSLA
ncbi:endonuclease domain-containing protein, partial [Pseudomonas oryzihabitans]|uniref:endonuclease domain-containing protein n=1 Tax=Pseudomonas oryzihabitans TaxID=47885 RepID=UPI0021B2C342